MDRWIKQLIVAGAYFLIFALIGYGIFSLTRTKPTCFDKIKNQNEEGVDCGAVCGNSCDPVILPLTIQSVKFIDNASGSYDFLAWVKNPNGIYGSGQVNFNFRYSDIHGVPKSEQGSFYITPHQTRAVIRLGLKDINISSSSFNISDALWSKVDLSSPPIDFPVQRESYSNRVYQGVILNSSDFDFDTVDVVVLVKDETGNVVAINKTNLNTFVAHTERQITVTWPKELPISNPHFEVQTTTNIFNNQNYLRTYGTQEKFQQYYSN